MTSITPDILLALALSLCVLVSIRAFYLRKKVSNQEALLKTAISSLASAQKELEKLRQIDKNHSDFKSNLNNAELTTQLQKPRLAFNQHNTFSTPPERYQYIHSLAEKGISSTDIATILSISQQEAEQLVTLAGLAKK